jgi:hypothetical protein
VADCPGCCECRAPLRCATPERPALQGAGNGCRAVPDARRRQHGAENRHRLGTVAQGALAAWAALRRVARSGAGTRRGTGGAHCPAPAVGRSVIQREASDERGKELRVFRRASDEGERFGLDPRYSAANAGYLSVPAHACRIDIEALLKPRARLARRKSRLDFV